MAARKKGARKVETRGDGAAEARPHGLRAPDRGSEAVGQEGPQGSGQSVRGAREEVSRYACWPPEAGAHGQRSRTTIIISLEAFVDSRIEIRISRMLIEEVRIHAYRTRASRAVRRRAGSGTNTLRSRGIQSARVDAASAYLPRDVFRRTQQRRRARLCARTCQIQRRGMGDFARVHAAGTESATCCLRARSNDCSPDERSQCTRMLCDNRTTLNRFPCSTLQR